MDATEMWAARGCDKCRKTGYSGRVGIYELLVVDDQLRDIIARNPNVAEFRRMCLERGMVSLRNDGIRKVKKGTSEPYYEKAMMKMVGIDKLKSVQKG